MPLGPPLPFGFGVNMIHSTAFLMADRLGPAGDKAEISIQMAGNRECQWFLESSMSGCKTRHVRKQVYILGRSPSVA